MASAAMELSDMAEALESSTSVAKSSEELAAAAEQLSATVEEANRSSKEIGIAIQTIAAGAAEQAAATEESSSAAEQIDRGAQVMKERADESLSKISALQGLLVENKAEVDALIAGITKVAESSGIKPPAIFVIGQVVAHAEALVSPEPRPLRGARLGIFAPRSELSEALQGAGAEVLLAPLPLTAAARLVIGQSPLSGWIVRTDQELEALDQERATTGFLGGITLWCMGAVLASLARERNWACAADIEGEGSPAHAIAKLRDSLPTPSSGRSL